MNKQRFIAGLMALTMSMGAFVGCTSKEEAAPAPSTGGTSTEAGKEDSKEQVTLTVTTWGDEINEIKSVVEEFETLNPNINIEIMEYPSEEYQDKLVIQLAGGANIDVMQMKNTADYSNIAAKKQLLDLEPYVKADSLDVIPYGPLYEGLKIDGQLFGLPYRKTAWVLFYNKDLFDAAGVAYPSEDMTWDQFRETAQAVTSGAGNEKVWGAYLHTWPQTWYGMGLQTGATIMDEDLSVFEQALQFRMDLEADGSIMPFTEAKATNAHYRTEFAKGQTAMNVIGDFHITQLRDPELNVQFDWDIVPMPHPEGVEANTTWGTANPIGINAKSKHPEEAWEFVKFIAGKEGAMAYAEAGKLPAYNDDEVNAAFIGKGDQKPANIAILTEAKVFLENPAMEGANIVKDQIFGSESELTFSGERSAADTFKAINERIQNEIKK